MGDKVGTSVNVLAIVSRRALINDEFVKSGAGKALLSSILSSVAEEFPGEPITLLGTPGDKHVEEMYRSHGMEEYGREETGMPKLRITYPAECVGFMSSGILCQELTFRDYLSFAWRMIPMSRHVHTTCAHLFPRKLFYERIRRSFRFW